MRRRGRPVARRAGTLVALLALSLALLPAAPSGAAGDARPPALRLPPDLIYDRDPGSPAAVVFRHVTHVEFTGTNCLACHPRPFRMLRPGRRVTHAEMDAGKACGVCHDGKGATATTDSGACGACHTGRPAAVAAPGARP